MKKTLTVIAVCLTILKINSQNFIADFESFTLSTNSFYKDTNNTPFNSINASFKYEWTKGSYPYWSGGFSYTNKYDSATAGYTNIYGVKPLKGYNNSSIYVVAKNEGVIALASPQNTVEGFYITNTTYAYKSMKQGDSFAKKFGGLNGNDPDYFKLTIKGYKNGLLKSDSVQFYLADYRSSNNSLDYIVNNWQWVNTSILGGVDSIKFFMYSTDIGQFGINTPLFFGMDNFTTKGIIIDITEQAQKFTAEVYPNPFNNLINIDNNSHKFNLTIKDVFGKIVYNQLILSSHFELDLNFIPNGIYFMEFISENKKIIKKVIKN